MTSNVQLCHPVFVRRCLTCGCADLVLDTAGTTPVFPIDVTCHHTAVTCTPVVVHKPALAAAVSSWSRTPALPWAAAFPFSVTARGSLHGTPSAAKPLHGGGATISTSPSESSRAGPSPGILLMRLSQVPNMISATPNTTAALLKGLLTLLKVRTRSAT